MKGVAIAAVAVALALPAAAGAGTASQPAVKFLRLIPASVQGAHFKPGERVGVTVSSGRTWAARTIRTSSTGSFTVVFGKLTQLDRCRASISLVAVGAAGDRAAFTVRQLECPSTR